MEKGIRSRQTAYLSIVAHLELSFGTGLPAHAQNVRRMDKVLSLRLRGRPPERGFPAATILGVAIANVPFHVFCVGPLAQEALGACENVQPFARIEIGILPVGRADGQPEIGPYSS